MAARFSQPASRFATAALSRDGVGCRRGNAALASLVFWREIGRIAYVGRLALRFSSRVRRMKFPGSRALFWAMRDGATVGSILRADSGEKPSLNHAFSRNAARPAKAGLALPVLGQGSGIGRAKLLLSRRDFSAESELTVRYFTRPIPPSGPPTGSALFKMVGRDRQVLT